MHKTSLQEAVHIEYTKIISNKETARFRVVIGVREEKKMWLFATTHPMHARSPQMYLDLKNGHP